MVAPCGSKLYFETQAQAQDKADKVNIMYKSNNIRPYRCIYCEGWHLTKSTITIVSRAERPH